MLSEKQIGYLCYVLRQFQSRLPQRYDERGVNCIWLDFEEWVNTKEHAEISPIIALFKDGRDEDGFDALVDLGMPVNND